MVIPICGIVFGAKVFPVVLLGFPHSSRKPFVLGPLSATGAKRFADYLRTPEVRAMADGGDMSALSETARYNLQERLLHRIEAAWRKANRISAVTAVGRTQSYEMLERMGTSDQTPL